MASALREETSKENIQLLSLLRFKRPFNNYGTSFKLGKCFFLSHTQPANHQFLLSLCPLIFTKSKWSPLIQRLGDLLSFKRAVALHSTYDQLFAFSP